MTTLDLTQIKQHLAAGQDERQHLDDKHASGNLLLLNMTEAMQTAFDRKKEQSNMQRLSMLSLPNTS